MTFTVVTRLGSSVAAGNPFWSGNLSTIDLQPKIACFVKINIFYIKRNWSELISTRGSTVLIVPLQSGFPGYFMQVYFSTDMYCLFGVGPGITFDKSRHYRSDCEINNLMYVGSSIVEFGRKLCQFWRKLSLFWLELRPHWRILGQK